MTNVEPSDWGVHAITLLAVLTLILLYNFGIWSRNYLFPAEGTLPLRRLLVAGIPTGLLTMSMYGRATLPGLDLASINLVFDVLIVAGNAIFFGMMSRETFDKFLTKFR